MEKNLDQKGRLRNHIVAFRMSEEESLMLNRVVALSGLTKQDYIIHKLSDMNVIVQGNPRVYKALKKQMEGILQELRNIEKLNNEHEELIQTIQIVANILNGLKENSDVMTVTGNK